MLVGWLWYLVMLLPVVGIIQVGGQAHADRYTYLPQIGIYVAVTWLAAEWGVKWHAGRAAFGGLMAAVLAVLMVCAWKQTAYWKNSETLWTHALACTTDNYMAHYNLGNALNQKGRVDEAIAHYPKGAANQSRLCGSPQQPRQRSSAKREEWTKRSPITKRRCKSIPTTRKPTTTSATLFCKRAEWTKRSPISKRRCKSTPTTRKLTTTLATLFSQKGKVDDAISEYHEALEIKPDYADARYNLGIALRQKEGADKTTTHSQ